MIGVSGNLITAQQGGGGLRVMPEIDRKNERVKKAEIVERVAGEAGITKQVAQAAVGGVSFKAGNLLKDSLR